MNWNGNQGFRVALLDLYEGVENQGMRCIREILNQFADAQHIKLVLHEFEVRIKNEIPDDSYDAYISSGGPGSPIESEGTVWENNFFGWIKRMETFNDNPANLVKKQVLFICHSFQLATRYFKVAEVSERKSTSFGVFPMHYLPAAHDEVIFGGLSDPFYAVDSRDYQVTNPRHNVLKKLGGEILAIEKARPHIPLERAIMSIRFRENMVGTQFHPEADANGMTIHLLKPDKKETVIKNHSLAKWESMVAQLKDPEKIEHTYNHIIPNFLRNAVEKMHPVFA